MKSRSEGGGGGNIAWGHRDKTLGDERGVSVLFRSGVPEKQEEKGPARHKIPTLARRPL